MNEIVSIYKDKFGKNWIVDLDGKKSCPGDDRESFTTWASAMAAAQCVVDSWALQYPGWAARHFVPGPVRAHDKIVRRRENEAVGKVRSAA